MKKVLQLIIPFLFAFIFVGQASAATPISTCQELQGMQNNLSGDYYLDGEIDCSDTVNWNDGEGFRPISIFTGTFDGQGGSISNLYISGIDINVGLFGVAEGAEIKNVFLLDFDLSTVKTGTGEDQEIRNSHCGTLVGYSLNSKIYNITAAEFKLKGNSTGGIVGEAKDSIIVATLTACQDGDCKILGNYAGGIVGEAVGSQILNSFTYLSMDDAGDYDYRNGILGSSAGGIVGWLDEDSVVYDSYASYVQIRGNNIGGLVGRNVKARIIDSFVDNFTLNKSTEGIEGDVNKGGVVGMGVNSNIINSYWNESSVYTDCVGYDLYPIATDCSAYSWPDENHSQNYEPIVAWDFDNYWEWNGDMLVLDPWNFIFNEKLYYCGDNSKNLGFEECDGSDFDNKSCADYGYGSGSLSCDSDCVIDTSNCTGDDGEGDDNEGDGGTCYDGDGENYYIRSYVQLDDHAYIDACYGDELEEWVCVDNAPYSLRYTCPGACEDGICVEASSADKKPDLIIEDIYFTPQNPKLYVDSNGSINVKIKNIGNLATSSNNVVAVKLTVDAGNGHYSPGWGGAADDLAPGASVVVTTALAEDSVFLYSPVKLTAEVDWIGSIDESNEVNNSKIVYVNLQDGQRYCIDGLPANATWWEDAFWYGNGYINAHYEGINTSDQDCGYYCADGYQFQDNACVKIEISGDEDVCEDHDGGRNIYVTGNATSRKDGSIRIGMDSCSNGVALEWTCVGTVMVKNNINCDYGCSYLNIGSCNGDATTQVVTPSCDNSENDTIDNVFNRSWISGKRMNNTNYTKYDECINSDQLKNWFCGFIPIMPLLGSGIIPVDNEEYINSNIVDCDYGCANGACLRGLQEYELPTCHDSDVGFNANFVKGKINGIYADSTHFVKNDECINSNQLREWSCGELPTFLMPEVSQYGTIVGGGNTPSSQGSIYIDNRDYVISSDVVCNYGCTDGACLKETKKDDISPAESDVSELGVLNLNNTKIEKIEDGKDRLILKLKRAITAVERKVVELEKKLMVKVDKIMAKRLGGQVLLQVEASGEAWFVDPVSGNKFYMKDGESAYEMLKAFGLGITTADLEKIPLGFDQRLIDGLLDSDNDGLSDTFEEAIGTDPFDSDTDNDGYNDGSEIDNGYSPLSGGSYHIDQKLIDRVGSGILLQVESRGEAWLVKDGKRYYIDPRTAYNAMRYLSLGISNDNIRQLQVGEFIE